MLKTLSFVFYTELLLLLRRSQEWLYPLAFFVIVVSLFPFAFTPDPAFLQKYIPGCIWIAALLGSLLSIQTMFVTDNEDGYLEQLLLSPTPLTCIIMIKLITQWLVTELPLILLTPLLGILFHLNNETSLILCISLLLGTPILTIIGCLAVTLTLGLRQQGVMLSLLILPLVTPVLIFGVNMVQQSQAGFPVSGSMAFLAGMMILSVSLLPWMIAVTLRISFDD